jgi:hypothetical protein
MVEQGVDQGPVAVAGGRVDDQPGRLVDDQQMLVLEDDRQRDVLRLVVRRLRLGDGERERLVAADLGRRVARRACRRGGSARRLDQRLQPLARQGRHAAASARSSRQPAWLGSSAHRRSI